MTKKELSQLYYLNREIEQYKKRLQEIEKVTPGIPIQDDVDLERMGDYAAEMSDLKALIELNIQKCWHELNRVNRYIESIDDSLMRQIMTYRYVYRMTWNQVADNVGGNNTEDSVRIAHNRFLKKNKV